MNKRSMVRYILFSVVCILLAFFEQGRAHAQATKIVDKGEPSSHIDLLFIGSGFTSAELERYKTSVAGNVSKMFSVNWFSDNKDLFNVWRVDAVSATSGIDLDETKIYSLAAQVPYDILIVIHNIFGQERVQKPYIELYKDSHNYVVLAHELGHQIGKLADEYYTQATAWACDGLSKRKPNIHDWPSNEKWADLITTSPFEGGGFCEKGLWRPSENSIMRDSANTAYFDAVGIKAMSLGAGKIIGTVEAIAPNLLVSGLIDGDTKGGTLLVKAVTSDYAGIERVEFYWAKAGKTSKSIQIDKTPPFDLSVDTSEFEDGPYYLDVLSYDKNWNYSRKTIAFNISNATQQPRDIKAPVHLRLKMLP